MTSGAREGVLTLVATPIGNLGDLPPRAVEVLRAAALVCCEDTRRSGRLLAHAGVEARRMAVVNAHTETAATGRVLQVLRSGGDVAVITDAGTPGISDPGERLVRAALDAGLAVSSVPGPSAVVTALVISGLPTARFAFEGFLPRSGAERAARLAELAGERRTVVLYEAPHRLARTLADLAAALGRTRRAVVARELTKLHEEVVRGTLAEAAAAAAQGPTRGEYVVVVEGAPPRAAAADGEIATELARATAAGASRRDAVASVAASLGVGRKRVYDLALRLEPPPPT